MYFDKLVRRTPSESIFSCCGFAFKMLYFVVQVICLLFLEEAEAGKIIGLFLLGNSEDV